MAWWGRVIGGALGSMAFGPLGILLGYAIGSAFDKRQSSVDGGGGLFGGFNMQERLQAAFFVTTFSVLGYVSKVDGFVSPQEIQFAEFVMRSMNLDNDQRKAAVGLFRAGKEDDFELEPVLKQFTKECGNRKNLKRMFVELLLGGALCDGRIDSTENEAIRNIANYIGFSQAEYAEMYNTVSSQQQAAAGKDVPSLSEDYKMLGLKEDVDDAEVKRAYRRKMSRLHPDKLVSQGLPDEMIEIATEKTKQVRAAYDRIRNYRKQQQTVQ